MTLPFRRRHHDDESSHDRARALTSAEMVEPLDADEAGWLARHLDACAECRVDREAFLADRALLRSLRDRAPEPPRDLWARTSAAIEREAGTRRSRGTRRRRGRGLSYAPMAGVLILLVVIGASLIPPLAPSESPGDSQAAFNTPGSEPTQMTLTAGRVAWIRPAADGSWEFVTADVASVCPRARPACQPLAEDDPGRPIDLAGVPTSVTLSPDENQLVIEARGAGTLPDRIYVVPVPSATPEATPEPTPRATPEKTPDRTAAPGSTPPTSEPVTQEPATQEPASPAPSPTEGPGVIEIASGVTVVGEAAYSADGRWLAFSARPSDGSTGPDLYLWTVGRSTAIAVTADHQTYFSAWLGDRVLASRVEAGAAPDASADPSVTDAPSADASRGPTATDDATAAPKHEEVHPASFLLDPATLTRTDIAQPDLWLPVVDSTGRFVAFWSGTLVRAPDGLDWQLGAGRLVLSRWSAGPDGQASPEPDASVGPDASPVPALGPTGTPVALIPGRAAAFKAKFDPSGTRLAVWIGEQNDAEVGRLHLVVIDATTGALAEGPEPLPGAPALRRFSIDVGRLAWVTPDGQDGQASTVQVLGWSSTDFGETRTVPAKALQIVG